MPVEHDDADQGAPASDVIQAEPIVMLWVLLFTGESLQRGTPRAHRVVTIRRTAGVRLVEIFQARVRFGLLMHGP